MAFGPAWPPKAGAKLWRHGARMDASGSVHDGRMTRRGVVSPGFAYHGAVEAPDGLSRCGRRNAGAQQCLRAADAPTRRRRRSPRGVYRVPASRQCRAAQPGAAPPARNGQARESGQLACRSRLRADRTAEGARSTVRRYDRGTRCGAAAGTCARAGENWWGDTTILT